MSYISLISHCVLNCCNLKVGVLGRIVILLNVVLLRPPQGAFPTGDHADVGTALHTKVLAHEVLIDPALGIPIGHHGHILPEPFGENAALQLSVNLEPGQRSFKGVAKGGQRIEARRQITKARIAGHGQLYRCTVSIVGLLDIGLIFVVGIDLRRIHAELLGPVRPDLRAFIARRASIIGLGKEYDTSFVGHGIPEILIIGMNDGIIVGGIFLDIGGQIQEHLILYALIISSGVIGGRFTVDIRVILGRQLEVKLLPKIHGMEQLKIHRYIGHFLQSVVEQVVGHILAPILDLGIKAHEERQRDRLFTQRHGDLKILGLQRFHFRC